MKIVKIEIVGILPANDLDQMKEAMEVADGVRDLITGYGELETLEITMESDDDADPVPTP